MAEQADETIVPVRGQRRRRLFIGVSCLLAIAIGLGVYIHYFKAPSGPVPTAIKKSLSFKVYYPDPKASPAGYELDSKSFRLADSGVVLFSVIYDNGRSMVFSEEARPPSDVINKFNSSSIPVHTEVSTPLGKAIMGAYGSGKGLRTIASLPISNGPWVIVTAPSDINQADLGKILGSLTK